MLPNSIRVIPAAAILPAPKKKFEYSLEGLRGLAALVVVWCHAVGLPNMVDPSYTPRGWLAYQVPAHLSVLLFFVLSGYVIGLTNQTPLTRSTLGKYLKKRFIRIYPIYLVAMVLTLMVAKHYPLATWVANFSFSQVLLAPVVVENSASWSLHYEVLFYLLFVPLSMYRVHPWGAALACFALGTANILCWPGNPLLTSYVYGFTFWLAGLGLARYPLPELRVSNQFLVGMLLLLLSMRNFNYLTTLTIKATRLLAGERLFFLPGADQFRSAIHMDDFAFLPMSMVCILVFTHQDFPGRRVLLWVLFGLPAVTFLYLAKSYQNISVAPYVMSSIFYLGSVALVATRSTIIESASTWLMGRLIKLGSVSYALYILHFPLMTGIKLFAPFAGTGFTYCVRFAGALILAVLLAWVLERKFQPWVRRVTEVRTSKPKELAA